MWWNSKGCIFLHTIVFFPQCCNCANFGWEVRLMLSNTCTHQWNIWHQYMRCTLCICLPLNQSWDVVWVSKTWFWDHFFNAEFNLYIFKSFWEVLTFFFRVFGLREAFKHLLWCLKATKHGTWKASMLHGTGGLPHLQPWTKVSGCTLEGGDSRAQYGC